MANKKVTDLTAITEAAKGDLLMIVDVSDTTDSAEGSSKKITTTNFGSSLKNKCVVVGSFFDNALRDVYLPVGNTETEYTTLQRSNKLAMPNAGQLLKVILRHEYTTPTSGTLSLTLRQVALDNTTTDKETITTTPVYASRMETTFEFTAAAGMAEGSTYAFWLENNMNQAMGNVSFTILFQQ